MIYRIKESKLQFDYPQNWKTSIEEDGTHLFYDALLGSFRITVVPISNNSSININSFINKEFSDNKKSGAQWLILGSFRFVYYKQKSKSDDETITHYYISGNDDFLLICTFSYDKSLEDTKEIFDEIEAVKNTLKSINHD